MKRIEKTLTLAVILVVFSAAAHAQVRTWVSTLGNDANDCSRTSPCRNFLAAVTAVNSGGEVVVLDSGGYGSVTVSKAVSIISPPGLHAAVAPTAATAITVSAGGGDVVVLRGLYLNSQGATTGVSMTSGAGLHLENIVINGFASGVLYDAASNLFVKDTVVRNNATLGISIEGNLGIAFASLDRVRMERNGEGLIAGADSRVTLRDCVASRNVNGYRAVGTGASVSGQLNIETSLASNNADGVIADSFGLVLVSNSVVTNNATGLKTLNADGTLRAAGTSISGNTTGLSAAPSSVLASFGNNALAGNTTDGTFTGTIPLE